MPFPVDLQSLCWEIGDSLWGFPWMTLQFFFFFLTAFKILSLTFAVLTMLGLGVDLFHFVWDFLCFWFWICVSYYRLNFQPWFHQIHFCLFLSPLLLEPLKFEFYYAWCYLQFSSVQSLSCVQLFATPWTAARQASLSITNSWSPPKPMSIESVMPCNHLIVCHPLLPCLQSFPASGSFQMSQLFASGGQSIGVSASTSVLPMNIQDWFPLGWTGWISLQSKDSQESSPTPQFKSIDSLALSFLYSPTVTSIHDHWKNHSLD